MEIRRTDLSRLTENVTNSEMYAGRQLKTTILIRRAHIQFWRMRAVTLSESGFTVDIKRPLLRNYL
jgi:hypothetical protein